MEDALYDLKRGYEHDVDGQKSFGSSADNMTNTLVHDDDDTDKVNDVNGWNAYILLVGFTASLSSLIYGYNISNIDSTKAVFVNCDENAVSSSFFTTCMAITDEHWPYVVSAFCLGGLFGALSAGKLANIFGRKKILFFCNLPYLAGTLLLAFAPNFAMAVVSRVLSGIGSGICTVVVPMYLSEIAPDKIRGQVSILHQAAIVVGIFLAHLLALPLSNATWWRLYFLMPAFVCMVQLALLCLCPESPKFLADKGNKPAAAASLKRLRKSFDVSEEVARLEAQRQQHHGSGSSESMRIHELFMSRLARKSLVVAIVYHLVQQCSGINAVFYYSTSLFSEVNIEEKTVAVLIGVLNILMTGVSIALMDQAGRRPLSLVSTLVMGVGAVGIVLSLVLNWAVVTLLFIFLFVGGFAVGLGPVPWVIIGDIFPTNAVEAGVSVAIAVNWTFNLLLAHFLLPIKQLIGDYLFLIFAGVLFSFLAFNYMYIPETKGKPADFL